MQYLLMIYRNEADLGKMDATARKKLTAEYAAFTQSIIQSGHFKAGDGLQPTSTATTVRVRDGKTLTTVEGLSVAGGLNPLQQAFQDHHGLQCGFCTSGILMSLTELLSDNPDPTEQEVRETLTGHLCRCTGYAGPVRAALATAEQLKNIKGAA